MLLSILQAVITCSYTNGYKRPPEKFGSGANRYVVWREGVLHNLCCASISFQEMDRRGAGCLKNLIDNRKGGREMCICATNVGRWAVLLHRLAVGGGYFFAYNECFIGFLFLPLSPRSSLGKRYISNHPFRPSISSL